MLNIKMKKSSSLKSSFLNVQRKKRKMEMVRKQNQKDVTEKKKQEETNKGERTNENRFRKTKLERLKKKKKRYGNKQMRDKRGIKVSSTKQNQKDVTNKKEMVSCKGRGTEKKQAR